MFRWLPNMMPALIPWSLRIAAARAEKICPQFYQDDAFVEVTSSQNYLNETPEVSNLSFLRLLPSDIKPFESSCC